jgi:hypothetical protein
MGEKSLLPFELVNVLAGRSFSWQIPRRRAPVVLLTFSLQVKQFS